MNKPLIVFLVDDEPSVRASLPLLLRQRGLVVETYDSAKSFLDGFDGESPGCLLLDLKMPDMNGLELQAELSRRGIILPIIFMTGYGGIPDSVEALKNGALDFLEKPFRQEALLERIDRAFDEQKRLIEERRVERRMTSRFERLTLREWDVLRLMISGAGNLSSKEIARKLGISNRTVDHHRARIMEKTAARSIIELVRMADSVKVLSNQDFFPYLKDDGPVM